MAERGGRGFLFDRETAITAITNGSIRFPAAARGTVSVLCHSDTAEGVYETGLKFPLANAVLRNTYPLGVSNEFTGAPGEISVREGTLIIIFPASYFPVSETESLLG
jgi:thiamine pyrophosphokinase